MMWMSKTVNYAFDGLGVLQFLWFPMTEHYYFNIIMKRRDQNIRASVDCNAAFL